MVGTSSPEHKMNKSGDGADNKWALKPHRTIEPPAKESPLLVVVLDGWGAWFSSVAPAVAVDLRIIPHCAILIQHAASCTYT